MTAFARGVPDKIPHLELDILPAVIGQIMPGATALDFYEEFDIDGV